MSNITTGLAERSSAPNFLKGHRQRLKSRFIKNGPENISDYELLELVLFRSIPRKDTKLLAKVLITVFGSFGQAINAPPHRLKEINGIGDATITDFQVLKASARMMLSENVREKTLLTSWSSVLEYCKAAMAFEEREQFRILFLDKKNKLIADEVQNEGTVDHTPVYPREVVKRALELSATAIILVHNHPSGDPTPSKADIDMTVKINEIAGSLGIIVHDHIIIGRDGHLSMKAQHLF